MSDLLALNTCDCPEDCDSNRYSYSVSSTVLDENEICAEKEHLFSDPKHVGLPYLMRQFEKTVKGLEINEIDVCRRFIKKVAFVQFQLASQTATQLKRELRVSLADQIANFGKV